MTTIYIILYIFCAIVTFLAISLDEKKRQKSIPMEAVALFLFFSAIWPCAVLAAAIYWTVYWITKGINK